MSVPRAILGEEILPRSQRGGNDARSVHTGEGQVATYADRFSRGAVVKDTVVGSITGDSGAGWVGSPRAQRGPRGCEGARILAYGLGRGGRADTDLVRRVNMVLQQYTGGGANSQWMQAYNK